MNPAIAKALPPPPDLKDFGGEEGLRRVLIDLYTRIFDDPMISYLFVGKDPTLLIEREFEWTAKALGLDLAYQGRSMAEAHQRHPIRRGHFHRRNELLNEAMIAHNLPLHCVEWWQAHSQALENAILGTARSDKRCESTANQAPIQTNGLWTSS